MAIAELHTGSPTITTTEYSLVNGSTTLASSTTDGVFQIFLDLANLTSGDEFEIDVKEKAVTAGVQRTIFNAYMNGLQGSPIWVSPSLILMHGWDVTLRKLSGTDRVIPYSIRQVA